MSIKKNLAGCIALVLALFVGIQSVTAPNAHAVVLISALTGNNEIIDHPGVGGVILCVVFLPVCVLDEKGTDGQVTAQDLRDNGYSEGDVQAITADQAAMATLLQDQGKKLVIEKTDTMDTVRTALRNLDPSVSEAYVHFVADMNSIH